MDIDLRKSLEELERDFWPAADNPSYLIARCEALRKRPLAELDDADLRLLIGQGIGLKFLLPLAMALLEDNPLADGGIAPGALLAQVVKATPPQNGDARLTQLAEHALLDPSTAIPKEFLQLIVERVRTG